MERNELVLGMKYKDVVTGFKGIATTVSYWMSGVCHVGLNRGVDEKGAPTESEWFDYQRLERVPGEDCGLLLRDLDKVDGVSAFSFEQLVKDKITGHAGRITGCSVHLIGCVQFCVQSATVHQGKPVTGSWTDWKCLEAVGAAEPRKTASAATGCDTNRNNHPRSTS